MDKEKAESIIKFVNWVRFIIFEKFLAFVNYTAGYQGLVSSNHYRENASRTNRLVIDYLKNPLHNASTGIIMMDFAGMEQSPASRRQSHPPFAAVVASIAIAAAIFVYIRQTLHSRKAFFSVFVHRDIASERTEKPFPIVAWAFSFCQINCFAQEYQLFCVAISIRLRTKISDIAGYGESVGGAWWLEWQW